MADSLQQLYSVLADENQKNLSGYQQPGIVVGYDNQMRNNQMQELMQKIQRNADTSNMAALGQIKYHEALAEQQRAQARQTNLAADREAMLQKDPNYITDIANKNVLNRARSQAESLTQTRNLLAPIGELAKKDINTANAMYDNVSYMLDPRVRKTLEAGISSTYADTSAENLGKGSTKYHANPMRFNPEIVDSVINSLPVDKQQGALNVQESRNKGAMEKELAHMQGMFELERLKNQLNPSDPKAETIFVNSIKAMADKSYGPDDSQEKRQFLANQMTDFKAAASRFGAGNAQGITPSTTGGNKIDIKEKVIPTSNIAVPGSSEGTSKKTTMSLEAARAVYKSNPTPAMRKFFVDAYGQEP